MTIGLEESVVPTIGLEETVSHAWDDLPLAHLPDDESWTAYLRGERTTRALCGASLLGFLATESFRRCPECRELMETRR